MTPGAGAGRRRPLFLGLIALLTFTGGWFGHGWSQLGARPNGSALTATAIDVIGGAGQRQPTQIQLSVLVSNAGPEEIRVLRPTAAGSGASIVQLAPPVLVVRGGQVGKVDAQIALSCDLPLPLALPALEVDLIDGGHQTLQVSDAGLLLDACTRSRPTLRPLAVSVLPLDHGRFGLRLSSPTGRRTHITAIRADGVTLTALPLPVTVTGQTSVDVRLTPPPSCPGQWLGSGIPSALTVDLAPDRASGTGTAPITAQRLYIGPALTSWLLTTSCVAGPG